ncbi:MAG: serine protease [Myxococcales bacterium]|nr:serine protease [Myxococcales bacterium]
MLTTLALISTLFAAPAPDSAEAGALQVAALERFHQQTFSNTAASVVFISGKDSLGSGFFISADGWILTNAHVVHDAEQFDVVLNDGRRFTGKVMERAKDDIDFALLKIDIKDSKPMRFDTSPVTVGTWISSIGHGAGMVWTMTTGMVSNVHPSGSKRRVFQTDMPINSGNSGGPIINRQGLVIGVVTAKIKGADNVNFGIRIDLALESLSKLGAHCECWRVLTTKGTPVFLDGEVVGSGPEVVIPAMAGSHRLSAVSNGNRLERSLEWPRDRDVVLK